MEIIPPPPNFAGIGITMSLCPSMRPSICAIHVRFISNIVISYSQKYCLWPEDVYWPRTKVIRVRSGSYLSNGDILEVPTSQKGCLWPVGVSWPWQKFIRGRCRSLAGNVQNSYPVYIFLMDIHWKLLHHKKSAYDPIMKMCLDFDSRSFGQVQGHCLWQCLTPACAMYCIKEMMRK